MNKTRILVVERQGDVLIKLRTALATRNCADIREEPDARRVVETATRFRPDIILMDANRPGLDGGDVVETLRAKAETQAIPMIFLTSLMPRNESRGHQGAKAPEYVVSKPVTAAELVRHIEKRLGRSL